MMTGMTENNAKIRRGLSARRDPACIQVLQDIVIPAGTILRDAGDNKFKAQIGECAEFVVDGKPGVIFLASVYKRVIA